MHPSALPAAVLAALMICCPLARAADIPAVAPAVDELKPARALIAKRDWGAAAEALATYTRANPTQADGFNLLGYSYRHLKRYDESLAAYNKALALDPRHRGAHEYIGEAYLQLGQLDKAKVHLDALDRLCFLPCEEYADLKKAYEAALAGRRK
ncbi:MAG: tetratricopeptide repeat protein [Hylemonella sp.]|nr:tetratricopeptide repeat protein [Hylemonella sp.]